MLGNPVDLRKHLKSILPASLVPGNVGRLNSVLWPFWYPVSVTMGAVLNGAQWEYDLSSGLRDSSFFQVDAEAGFLMTELALAPGAIGAFWRDQPITVDIQDRQSTRNFMNSPMPINMLGNLSNSLVLERPLYQQPRGIIAFNFGTFYTGAPVTRVISTTLFSPASLAPRLTVIVKGYRVRVEDADKILSPVFGIPGQEA